ncbi:MAG: TonB C-terminal domain-containing protein [Saccharospirillaceae bacterium]|nr:TonB C-terminal domain-containing protein [Pseudomonadales bacterium]NRB77465.1 TonB C-terminal domain-containing protein [Saccharospirillaceae bacterium]
MKQLMFLILIMIVLPLNANDLTIQSNELSTLEFDCKKNVICEEKKVDIIASIIMQQIQLNWSKKQSERNLTAKIHLSLNNNGEIKLLEFDQPSADAIYDESLLLAINNAFPIKEIHFINPALFNEHLKEIYISFGVTN